MAFYKSIFIAAGALAVVYMMLKVLTSLSGKASEKDSNSGKLDELEEKEADEKPVESEESKLKVLTSLSGKASEKDSNSEKLDKLDEKQADEKPVESEGSKPKAVRRKTDDYKGAMKLPRLRPNFFIAFQVNDIGIHQKVKKFQEKVILKNPLLFPALVNVSTLHITLAVTHLASEKDINAVKKKLDEWAEKDLQKYFDKPCTISFTGVNTFNNTVAYVDIEQCENYKKVIDLSKNVNNLLSSLGYTTDKSGTPQLTFLKLTKDFRLLKSKKNFKADFESMKECNEHFGKQKINQIQLLSMKAPKDKFGYYKCFHQIQVSDSNPNMDHNECCAPIAKPSKTAK